MIARMPQTPRKDQAVGRAWTSPYTGRTRHVAGLMPGLMPVQNVEVIGACSSPGDERPRQREGPRWSSPGPSIDVPPPGYIGSNSGPGIVDPGRRRKRPPIRVHEDPPPPDVDEP